MLAGYKTYITVGLGILNYIAQYLTGEIELLAAINGALPLLAAAFIRSGLKLGIKGSFN